MYIVRFLLGGLYRLLLLRRCHKGDGHPCVVRRLFAGLTAQQVNQADVKLVVLQWLSVNLHGVRLPLPAKLLQALADGGFDIEVPINKTVSVFD